MINLLHTLRDWFARRERRATERRDLDVINQNAERLNQEAEDVLAYQSELIVSAFPEPPESS